MSDLVRNPEDRFSCILVHIGRVIRETGLFAFAKTVMQINFAVTEKLISAFVFATGIVQFLFILNRKFQAANDLL